LKGFVEPSVPAVPAAASTVQHLSGHAALVDVLRHPWHWGVEADSAYALLDRTHRFLVGLIWERKGTANKKGEMKYFILIGERLEFERGSLKDAVLDPRCTTRQYLSSWG